MSYKLLDQGPESHYHPTEFFPQRFGLFPHVPAHVDGFVLVHHEWRDDSRQLLGIERSQLAASNQFGDEQRVIEP